MYIYVCVCMYVRARVCEAGGNNLEELIQFWVVIVAMRFLHPCAYVLQQIKSSSTLLAP